MRQEKVFWKLAILAFLFFALIGLLLWGWPKYKVYQLELKGQASLKEAQWSKQIRIQDANAQKESAKLLAQAEVERAKGVAEANRIIGNSLKENEAYLRYLWIEGLKDDNNKVIYVPTEANLPVLEANRLSPTER